MTETDLEIEDRARKILEDRVRRETIVDGRLEDLEQHQSMLNGQIARGAKATELVAERVHQVDEKIGTLRTDLRVDRALQDQELKVSLEKQAYRQRVIIALSGGAVGSAIRVALKIIGVA